MMRKIIGILLCTALAAAMMAGCGDNDKDNAGNTENTTSDDKTSNDKTGDDLQDTETDRETNADQSDSSTDDESAKVGISMPTQSLKRWNRDGAYLEEQLKAAGYETILTYADDDTEKQAKDIRSMLAEDVDLLVVAAVDGSALNTELNTVMDEAAAADVPVIAYDSLIMNDAVSYYVSFDHYKAGRMQGEFIIEYLDLENASDEIYNMEITAGDPADHNAVYYYQGAFITLQPYIDKGTLNIVSGQTDFDIVATPDGSTDAAHSRAQNLLSSYYTEGTQLDVWLCSNNSAALGVTQAIASDYAGSNPILVTGQGGDIANLKNIADDIQTMTVYENECDESIVTLALAKAILAGDTIDSSLIAGLDIECAFDTESYETSEGSKCPSILLVPDVITKDNLQDLADTGLYTMGDDGYLSAAD